MSPRDIQARIRAGESVEDVARLAGVPVERLDAFAAPVIAEREHVAALALTNPVRRRGETSSSRVLRKAITEHLMARGIDPDSVTWEAHLLGARRWQVRASFVEGDLAHEGLFVYDVNSRFSAATNEDARWMIGESSNEQAAKRVVSVVDPVDDELALVLATKERHESVGDENDAYGEIELTEIDGIYDIVPTDDSKMDALYDMLASFDEDSVRIYAGLIHPAPSDPPVLAESAPSAPTPPLPEGARVEPQYVPDDVAARQSSLAPGGAETAADVDALEDAEPTASMPITEPEQPSLLEDPAPAKPARKARRASVPTWDEIMFGAPRQGPRKG